MRPLVQVHCDHLFRSIATSVTRVLVAPLDVAVDVSLPRVGQARQEAVPVVNRRARGRRAVPSRQTQRGARGGALLIHRGGRRIGRGDDHHWSSFCGVVEEFGRLSAWIVEGWPPGSGSWLALSLRMDGPSNAS